MKRLSVCGTLYGTKVNVKPCLKRLSVCGTLYVEPCMKRLSVCGTLYETVKCMWNPVWN